MSKRAVIRWCMASLAATVLGVVLVGSGAISLAAHHGAASDGYGRALVTLIVVGGLFIYAAVVLGLVAWAKALANMRDLGQTTWFRALLWGGIAGIVTLPIFGLGWLVFVNLLTAYAIAGPVEPATAATVMTPPKAVVGRWSWGFAAGGAGTALALIVSNLTNSGGPLNGHTWPSLALIFLGSGVIGLGAIAIGAAWWAAAFNAHALSDKTWFRRVLWGGVVAELTMPLFGLGAVILAALLFVYSRRAPDATTTLAPIAELKPQPPVRVAS